MTIETKKPPNFLAAYCETTKTVGLNYQLVKGLVLS